MEPTGDNGDNGDNRDERDQSIETRYARQWRKFAASHVHPCSHIVSCLVFFLLFFLAAPQFPSRHVHLAILAGKETKSPKRLHNHFLFPLFLSLLSFSVLTGETRLLSLAPLKAPKKLYTSPRVSIVRSLSEKSRDLHCQDGAKRPAKTERDSATQE